MYNLPLFSRHITPTIHERGMGQVTLAEPE